MPEMDGLQSTKAIRKWYASPEGQSRLTSVQLPPVIIAMTANAMRGDKEQCLEAGMDDYISKPIDFAAVIEKLSFWGTRVAQGKSV
jgi:CheY-like chemotaxis protein